MSNILLAYPNRADAAVLTDGAWSVAFPLNNAKNGTIGKVARSTNALLASTKFAVDLGASRSLQMVSLVGHNLTTAALVRVRTSNAGPLPAAVANYDSGWVNALRLTFQGDTPSDWGARYPVLDVFDAVTARYLYVEIDDTANPAGYIQFGRLVIGGGFQPIHNANRGMQRGRRDLSSSFEMQGGEEYSTARRRPRFERFTIGWANQAEADRIHEMLDEIGTVDEVFYVPDPGNLAHSQRYGCLGRLRELGTLEAPYVGVNSIALEVKEKL